MKQYVYFAIASMTQIPAVHNSRQLELVFYHDTQCVMFKKDTDCNVCIIAILFSIEIDITAFNYNIYI